MDLAAVLQASCVCAWLWDPAQSLLPLLGTCFPSRAMSPLLTLWASLPLWALDRCPCRQHAAAATH